MTASDPPPFYEELGWQAALPLIRQKTPQLADIIEELSPPQECTLWAVRYPFGSHILRKGQIHLMTNAGSVLPIMAEGLDARLCDALSYSNVPLGIVTHNAIEIFRDLDQRIFPLALYENDLHIGVWEHFGWQTPLAITAGARSLYMLPRIGTAHLHRRLQQAFGIKTAPPHDLYDHWKTFQALSQSDAFASPWYAEVLYFSRPWIDGVKGSDECWLRLRNYILQLGWKHSGLGRHKMLLDFMWHEIARTLIDRRMRPNPYIIDAVQHLITLGTGQIAGFIPETDDETVGPLARISSIYTEVYNLKEYQPVIMRPAHLQEQSSLPVYYSMQTPTHIETVPKTRNVNSNMDDLREIRELIEILKGASIDSAIKLRDQKLRDILEHLEFDYFHSGLYTYGAHIRPSSKLPEYDERFAKGQTGDLRFADNGAFVRGCVAVRNI